MPSPADHVVLSPSQAGRFLGRSAKAVRALLDRGELAGTRIGSLGHRRVTLQELLRYERAEGARLRAMGVRHSRGERRW